MTATAGAHSLPPGTRIGGYRLDGLLGRGGMGAVYLAEQLSIGRQVAVKVMHPARLEQPGALEAFLAEARRAATLKHPALVAIHEAGVDLERRLAYYSMDYVHGKTLRVVSQQRGPMEEGMACGFARQIAQGLAKAHAAGLVHRDLKPENVLVDTGDRAVVTDLGLALDRVGGSPGSNHRRLTVVGTPGFSAPEQCRNPARAMPASDVFSLGCILYLLLTGRDPFEGETLIDLICNVVTQEPAGLEQLPGRLVRVLRACLAKEPWRRPADGAAADALLAQALQEGAAARSRLPSGRLARRRR